MFLIFAITLGALGFTLWLGKWTLAQHVGRALRSVAPIREAAPEGFLATQYSAIGRYALVMAVVLYFLYLTKPTKGTLSASTTAAYTAFCFCTARADERRAVCNVGMWVSVRANVRTAAAALRCVPAAIDVALRGACRLRAAGGGALRPRGDVAARADAPALPDGCS